MIIRDILIGINQQGSLDIEFTPSDLANMNYDLITSVVLERSFINTRAFFDQTVGIFYLQTFSNMLLLSA
jgi:hypothetical protein